MDINIASNSADQMELFKTSILTQVNGVMPFAFKILISVLIINFVLKLMMMTIKAQTDYNNFKKL